MVLTFGIALHKPIPAEPGRSPLKDLMSGFSYVRRERPILMMMWLALLANLTAFPLSHGLLPAIAKDLYGFGEIGLANMQAVAAIGSLAGSLIVAARLRSRRAEPYMLYTLIAWHLLVVLFVLTPPSPFGWVLLALIGITSSVSMVTMAIALLHYTAQEYRGRVMGVRMLAVYGLPVGLLIAGALIERFGITSTLFWYGSVGLVVSTVGPRLSGMRSLRQARGPCRRASRRSVT